MKLIGIQDAAARLGVSPRTLQRWCRSGAIESVKLGGARGAYVLDEAVVESRMKVSA